METQNNKVQNPAAEEMQDMKKKINKRQIINVVVIVLAVVIAGLVWYLVNLSASHKADEAVALADTEMLSDSVQLAKYMDAAQLGHKSGNRAKLNVAIALYDKGEYEQAIKYLSDASIKSEIIDAGRLTLMGDCYVNLEKYDDALNCYNKAISASDNNPQIIPFVLVKEANIYRAQGKYAEEYKAYQTIFDKYPEYAQNLNFDIRKYAERARIAAGK